MNKLPSLYHKHIENQLTWNIWVMLKILIALLQEDRWVRLETLANQVPKYIKFESRRRGLQRFLS
ncbi:MAG: hypothetical protein F6K18_13200 [Okeania sp. SIO2C2]|uniref:hypothetical protein n=1 Tax=Okeania sp. SIO2C2 TaxID=2607787 RepID=UPI0013B80453|nr:hypothetical protein [Okeania sp. SIO2C2]NEP87692.1 hypothetical protein [Okeania sp. SIO2C2]